MIETFILTLFCVLDAKNGTSHLGTNMECFHLGTPMGSDMKCQCLHVHKEMATFPGMKCSINTNSSHEATDCVKKMCGGMHCLQTTCPQKLVHHTNTHHANMLLAFAGHTTHGAQHTCTQCHDFGVKCFDKDNADHHLMSTTAVTIG